MSTQNEIPKRSLVRKMAEVMGEVDRVKKNGRNNFHNYDYATEADIVQAVREGLSKRSVMMFPSITKTEWAQVQRAKGGTERLCTLTVAFTFVDGDSGEERTIEVLGEGQDAGDKATYKGFTGAVKYALLKTFLIPTGDDPEADDDPAPSRAHQRSKPQVPPPPARTESQSDGDPLSAECAAIVKAAAEATTQEQLQKLKPRAVALPKEGPEYRSAAKALTEAFGRISKGAA